MAIEIYQLEQRLSSIETALSEVQRKLGLVPPSANWVDDVSGSLADIPEAEYQEFLACCREVRNETQDLGSDESQP
ncbi:MAG: hypothetical protein JWM11_6997 [Planctomycetaceae bacterium]|nr:hypothetical protein [Planctomycetaceae bacterium]